MDPLTILPIETCCKFTIGSYPSALFRFIDDTDCHFGNDSIWTRIRTQSDGRELLLTLAFAYRNSVYLVRSFRPQKAKTWGIAICFVAAWVLAADCLSLGMVTVLGFVSSWKGNLLVSLSWRDRILQSSWLRPKTSNVPSSRASADSRRIFGAFGVFGVVFSIQSTVASGFRNAAFDLTIHIFMVSSICWDLWHLFLDTSPHVMTPGPLLHSLPSLVHECIS